MQQGLLRFVLRVARYEHCFVPGCRLCIPEYFDPMIDPFFEHIHFLKAIYFHSAEKMPDNLLAEKPPLQEEAEILVNFERLMEAVEDSSTTYRIEEMLAVLPPSAGERRAAASVAGREIDDHRSVGTSERNRVDAFSSL